MRARVRALLLLLGCSRAVVFLGVVLLLLFAGDYALRLPLAVRQVAFFATLAGLALVVFRRLILPLRTPLSDTVLAMRVEERYPELDDRLVSSLAFLDAANDPENEDSPELMRAVIEETAGITPRIRFADVAHARIPMRWAGAAAAVVLCGATAAFAQPKLTDTFVQRAILLRDVSWPRRTTLSVVDMEPGTARRVTLHHDTMLRIRAEGAVPERIELRFRETGGARERGFEEVIELAATADDPSLFTFNLNVDADYEFSVRGGDDDRGELYRIEALTPPAVLSIEMTCTYPAYLEREDAVLTDGDQRLPEGTVIDLRATVNMDLTDARIQVAGGQPQPLEKVDERVYRTRLEPAKDLRYSFLLVGPHGERNEPHTFVLRISKDRAPDLRIRAPSARTERTAKGVALISFTARDDHRIQSARFSYSIDGEPEQTVELEKDTGRESDTGPESAVRFLRGAPVAANAGDARKGDESQKGDRVLGLVVLDMARLKRANGDAMAKDTPVTYRIDVVDSAGKTTKTRAGRMVQVTADTEIEAVIEGRQRDLHDGLERTEAQADTVRVELAELDPASPAASPTGGLTDADLRRQIGRAQAATGRLTDNLSVLSGHLRSLVNLYAFNRLDDAATANQLLPFYERHLLELNDKSQGAFRGSLYRDLWKAQTESRVRAGGAYLQLLEMADLADRLARDHSPAAYAALRVAMRRATGAKDADPSPAGADPLTITVREQDQIEAGLQRLRRLMREWQSYEGVVRGIRRLREDEKRIIEELTDSKKAR